MLAAIIQQSLSWDPYQYQGALQYLMQKTHYISHFHWG